MSIKFLNIADLADAKELIIMSNPEKVLINFWAASPQAKLSSDYLYALKISALKKYKNNLENMNFLVYEDIPLPQNFYHISGLNIIVTKDIEIFQRLKLKAQELFDTQSKISNYAYQLMTICHTNSDHKELMDAGYRYLNNPLLLVNTSLVVISSSGLYDEIKDPLLAYCVKNGHMPPYYINSISDEKGPQINKDFPALLLFEKGSEEYIHTNIIAGRIMCGNQLLGYLKIFECNHPITETEKMAFTILCEFLSIALSDSLPRFPVSDLQIQDFLTDLLKEKITLNESIEARISLYHLDNYQDKITVLVKCNSSTPNIDRLYLLKKQLKTMFNISTITFFNQLIVMVVPAKSLWNSREQLEQFMHSNNMIAGASLSFKSYSQLRKYYMQALACLEIHSRFELKDIFVDYDDWKLIHLFLYFQNCCELTDLIPKSIRTLQKNDNQRGTNLVETLFAYMRHGYNIADAAYELHLHYNTMKYRLNQITDLTDIDFDDMNCMFRISVAEKVTNILNENFDSLQTFSKKI